MNKKDLGARQLFLLLCVVESLFVEELAFAVFLGVVCFALFLLVVGVPDSLSCATLCVLLAACANDILCLLVAVLRRRLEVLD